jgi:hypothetical protein
MPSFIRHIVPSHALHSIRWLAAVAFLAFIACRHRLIGAHQWRDERCLAKSGTRTFALVMLATPLVLAVSRRSSSQSGNL